MKTRAERRVVWQGGRAARISHGLQALLRPMVEGIEASRQGLLELFHAAGVEALGRQLADEVEAVVGPKRRRNPTREAYRWGSTASEFVLGGRQVALPRPRVRRRDGGEMSLPSVRAFQDEDPFTERVIEQALVGVSQRRYGRSLEPLAESVPERATSKSAVQRRLVAGTRRLLGAWLRRDLSDFQPLILMIDGLEVAGHTLVVALGIARDGTKRVLGLREGATENAALCTGLLQELLERGLAMPPRFLAVLDGGKGLRKAVRAVFGDATHVQRCQLHKRRNVRDHLPKQLQARVDRLMVEAYQSARFDLAKRRLEQLARWLEHAGHAGHHHRQPDAGEHDQLELRRLDRARAPEQGADERAGQGHQAGGPGLVHGRQQRLAQRLAPDLLVRQRGPGAEREHRLDLAAPLPARAQEVAARERRRGHAVADQDAGDRDQLAYVELHQPEREHRHHRHRRAGHDTGDRDPSAVAQLPQPARGRPRGGGEHQQHEGHDRPGHGEDPAQQQRDHGQLHGRAQDRPERRQAEPDPGPQPQRHGQAADGEHAEGEEREVHGARLARTEARPGRATRPEGRPGVTCWLACGTCRGDSAGWPGSSRARRRPAPSPRWWRSACSTGWSTGTPAAGAGAWLHDHAITAFLIANGASILLTYALSRWWAFRNRQAYGPLGGVPMFFVISIGSLVIPVACLWFSRNVLELSSATADNVAANGVGLFLGFVTRFALFRSLVFRPAVAAPSEEQPAPRGELQHQQEA